MEKVDAKVKDIMVTLKTVQNCIVLMVVEYMKSAHNIEVFKLH